jgi:large subunit ribosomal protein L6
MSRIGRKPVEIPAGVTVTARGNTLSAKSSQGEMTLRIPDVLATKVEGGKVEVLIAQEGPVARVVHGTTRTLVANMLQGLNKPYVKELEIQGVGFRAQLQGQKLTLSLGYSHPIEFQVPAGIKVAVADGTNVAVSGPDKHLVGDVAARIRGYFPAEPYKGKGVRYKGERVRRKAGKAVA